MCATQLAGHGIATSPARPNIPLTEPTPTPKHPNSKIQHPAHIVHRAQVLQERTEVRQLGVVRVVEPRRDGHGVVRVEDV